jgi:hypothetical protein
MVAAHVMAIVIAFGVTFAYPLMGPFVAGRHPRSLVALHEVQDRIGKLLITPFATIALLVGIYLTSHAHYWHETWVQVPLAILIVVLGLGGAFFAPHERKAAALASRDIEASGAGDVVLSAEYQAVVKRVAGVGALANLLVLVAIYFMVARPFA